MEDESNDYEVDMDMSSDECYQEEPQHNENTDEAVPKIGMMFNTIKEAKCYYNSYARKVGFSIKTRRTVKTKGDDAYIRLALFTCTCEGNYTKVKTPQKRRANQRFGCKEEFHVLFVDGKYKLTKFEEEHTHELVPPDQAHLLRSQRKIEPTQAMIIDQMQEAGIRPLDINSYMCGIAGGAQNLNFTKVDCYNYFQKKRRDFLKEGDVKCLKDWFGKKKRENKHFFSRFWTDGTGEVRGVFFCDAKSIRDYALFGDVICFDTTFKTNDYNMVCAPLVGVNNHWQTTLFGCGLLEGETTKAIVWLFTTFLEAMGGKEPDVIFTDQAAAIKSAIKIVFPRAHHRLCLWHIYQNALKHLGSTVKKYPTFLQEFKWCVYNPETISEFEACWTEMLTEFQLSDNEYLQSLFEKRKDWALVYGRAYFCAGMTTTQRSEGINKFLKDFFDTKTILQEFVDQYMKAMDNRRESERAEEYRTRQTSPILFSTWNVEKEASEIYTKKIFNRFQEECKKLRDLDYEKLGCEENIYKYSVIQLDGKSRPRTLLYDSLTQFISCTCRKFEFEGVICCHALKLFRVEFRFTSLPPGYYLKRWTREITRETVVGPFGEPIMNDIDPSVTARYSELSHITQRIVALGATSSTHCFQAKEKLLELEKQLALIDIPGIDFVDISTSDRTIHDADLEEDVALRNPKSKKVRGEQKARKKSALESKRRKKNVTPTDEDNVSGTFINKLSENVSLPNPYEPYTQVPFSTLLGSYHQNQLSQDTLFMGTQASQSVSRRLFDSSFPYYLTSFEE